MLLHYCILVISIGGFWFAFGSLLHQLGLPSQRWAKETDVPTVVKTKPTCVYCGAYVEYQGEHLTEPHNCIRNVRYRTEALESEVEALREKLAKYEGYFPALR